MGLKTVVRRQVHESPQWTEMSGGRVCNPGHPAPEIRSVGLVLLAVPSVLQASPAPHAQPNPPGSGPAVPALGIGLPSPAGQCVGVSTEQAPSLGSLKVSASRSLHDWRATRCPQVSTNLPRGVHVTHRTSDLAIRSALDTQTSNDQNDLGIHCFWG